jgi:large subunit ribosomal protein L13
MRYTSSNLQQTVWVHPNDIKENRDRWVVNAEWKTLWRLAVEITKKLMWKNKAYYCEHWDCGDYVVVTNADKLIVTWNKMNDKVYYRHTGYKGHLRETPLHRMLEKHPLRVIELAIKWMLPKNKQRKERLKRLKVFVGADHPYSQFSPKELQS